MPQPGEILTANTVQPLAADPDYSGLTIAPPIMVWIATGVQNVINPALWLLKTRSCEAPDGRHFSPPSG